jgi:hypothetical protein
MQTIGSLDVKILVEAPGFENFYDFHYYFQILCFFPLWFQIFIFIS